MHPARQLARRRLGALGILVAVIAGGLATHLFLPETAMSDVAGDALYAVAVYLFVVAMAPRWSPVVAAGFAVGWCVAIELFQLTGVPMALGAGFAPVVLVLGTVFDPRDLVVYPLAIVVVAGLDVVVGLSRAAPPRRESR